MRALIVSLSFLLLGASQSLAAPPKGPNKDEEPPEVRYAAMLAAEYGPLGKTTDAILSHEKDKEPATVVGALVYRLRDKPVERLSAIEKKLLAVYNLKEEVDNGGFNQYFTSPLGDSAALALQGFRDMGAAQLTRTVQKAISVFPAAKPPVDTARRAKLMDTIKRRANATWGACDEEFYLREEELPAIALAFVKKHRASVTLP